MTLKKTMAALLMCVLVLGSIPVRAEVVTISVAGSMTDAFKKLAGAFEQANPGITVQLNFASSGALAKQISQGAPADIFVSANTTWMDYLVEKKFIDGADVRIFAHNSLVFVGGKDRKVGSLDDLAGLDRIALGSPASVPAGEYAEQAMRAAGVYETLLAANKFIMAKDVRQALMYADRGEADGAFVYRTDALLAENVVILYTVPTALYPRIDYPLAMTITGRGKPAVRSVFAFLNGKEALGIIELFGFLAPDGTPGHP